MESWLPLRADVDAELLLDPREVLVELAVKRAREPVVVEGQYDMRHVGRPGGQRTSVRWRRSNVSPADRPAAVNRRSANRLLGPAFVICTLTMSPISPAFSSTITGCSQGERPTFWPGSRPGFSSSTSIVVPTRLCGEFRAAAGRAAPAAAASRSSLTLLRDLNRQIGARRSGARRIFERKGLRIADLAHDRIVSSKSSSLSPGKPTMKSPDSAMSGRAARMRVDEAQIVRRRMAAVHRLEDAVGARLHRQVQIGHQRRRSRWAAISSSSMSRGWLVV